MVPKLLLNRTNKTLIAGGFALVSFGVPFGWSVYSYFNPRPEPPKASEVCLRPRGDIDDHLEVALIEKAQSARADALQGQLTDQRILAIKKSIYEQSPDSDKTATTVFFIYFACTEILNASGLDNKYDVYNRISGIM